MEGVNAEVSTEVVSDILVSDLVDAAVAGVDASGFNITELKLDDASSTFNGGLTALGVSAFVNKDVDSFVDTDDIFSFGSTYTGGLADTTMTGLVLITDVLTTADSATLL